MTKLWRRQQQQQHRLDAALLLVVVLSSGYQKPGQASASSAQGLFRKPHCMNYKDSDNVTQLIPPFALCDSEKEFQLGFDRASENLQR